MVNANYHLKLSARKLSMHVACMYMHIFSAKNRNKRLVYFKSFGCVVAALTFEHHIKWRAWPAIKV